MIWGLGSRALGFEFRVQGSGSRAWDFGLRPSGLGRLAPVMREMCICYKGTSLTRTRPPLGPDRRPMPRVLGGS